MLICQTIVRSFQIDKKENYSIYYEYQNLAHPENYVRRLGADGLWEDKYAPTSMLKEGAFDINDVIQGISEKMIRRHPHVFGNANAEDSSAVRKQWDEIKAEENKGQLKDPSAMAKVPKGFPPLSKAQELQRRATKVGFDWKHAEDSFEKVVEEFKEFEKERQATDFPDKNRLEEEFGDILFSLINYGRHCGLNAALALSKANNKFEKRFRKMEVLAETSNFKDKTETEVLSLWEKAKGS